MIYFDELTVLLFAFLVSIFIVCICCSSLFPAPPIVGATFLPIIIHRHRSPTLSPPPHNHRCRLVVIVSSPSSSPTLTVASSFYNYCTIVAVTGTIIVISSSSSFSLSSLSSYSSLSVICFQFSISHKMNQSYQ